MKMRPTRIAALSATVALASLGAASAVTNAGSATDRPASVPPAGEPLGDGCADLPTDGDGSPEAMAELPAGSAIASNPELATLAAAVEEAGLGDALDGDGPITVFAPNNSAFDRLPAAVFDSILSDADLLTTLLGYHVVDGEALLAADLATTPTVTTLAGDDLSFAVEGDTVTINGTTAVVCANITVANGVVHIVDGLLQPPSSDFGAGGSSSVPSSAPNVTAVATPADGPNGPDCATLPAEGEGSITEAAGLPAGEAIAANPLLTTLAAALESTGILAALDEEEGPWTIFAPSDAAFEALGDDLDTVLGNPEQLAEILTFHVVKGQSLSAANLVTSGAQVSEQGGDLTFASQADGSVAINDGAATVTCSNIAVANGTIHIINTVLVPPVG